jgi:hypothetical protein
MPNLASTPRCLSCGVPADLACFNCFLQRPFEKDVACPLCGTVTIVRQYLDGVRCDQCAQEYEGAKRMGPQ